MNVYVIALIVAALIGITVFFGYVKSIGKSFDTPTQESSIDTTKSKQQQQEQVEEVEAQRKAYMEDVRQKIRDSQRR